MYFQLHEHQYVTMQHKSDSFCMYGTLILTHHSVFFSQSKKGWGTKINLARAC